MKRQVRSFAKIAGLSAVLGSALLMAQPGQRASAEIPFDFTVQNMVLPSGTYWVEDLHSVLKIHGVESQKTIILLTQPCESRATGESRLVFARYGDSYFLSQVFIGDGDRGSAVGQGRAEKKLNSAKTAPVLAAIRMK
jgi:hypothetical protein